MRRLGRCTRPVALSRARRAHAAPRRFGSCVRAHALAHPRPPALVRSSRSRRPAVLCRPPIWGLLFVHCVLLYLHKELGIDLGMIVEGTKDVSAVSTKFLIFFLVYYGGNCYKRYYDMYNACMSMAGDVQCWVGLARVYFPTATPDILWNLSRHMVASVYFLYFELGGLASDGGRVITEAEWSVLFRSSLISQSERKVLEKYRGSRFFLMQSWALRLAADQMSKPDKASRHTSAPPLASRHKLSRVWMREPVAPLPTCPCPHARVA